MRINTVLGPLVHANRAPLPPGPGGLPIIGSLLGFRRDPLGFLTRCAREYGEISYFRIGNFPTYLLCDPDAIERVLSTTNRDFVKPPEDSASRLLFGSGLLTSSGDLWLRQRRLMQPAFHRDRIAAYGKIMVDCAEQMLTSWQDGQIRDVLGEMTHVTLVIVTQTLFGANMAAQTGDARQALGVVGEVFAKIVGNLFWTIPVGIPTPTNLRFRQAVRQLDEIIYGIIRQRRASNQGTGDLLSMLLHVQDEDGSRMTDQQLRDEVMTLFLAGHATTALALSWTWYLLSRNPDVEAKLVAELRRVLDGRAPVVADIPQLPYTEKVIKESMRLYPPAWIVDPRVPLHDCEIGGYCVPKGAMLMMSQWVMHRDPRYYDEPERFNPGRWTEGFVKHLPRYAYFPFGGGPRLCIGNSFAIMEAILLLATIAQRFRLTLLPGHPVVPRPSITLRPKYGIKVILSER